MPIGGFCLSCACRAPNSAISRYARSLPKLQAQVDVGAISGRLEDFQLQGAMCLGASLARYGEVEKYSKYRCDLTFSDVLFFRS